MGNNKQNNNAPLKELIKKIPKNDLHVHLDGSIRLETIIDISKKENLKLPSHSVEGLNETVFKERYASLEEYLTTFTYSCAAMQRPENLERIAYELAVDNQEEGVRYIEVRFAPQLHINQTMDMESVLKSVNNGLQKAQREYNKRPEIINGLEPAFHYGIIICAMRTFGPWSDYYDRFIKSHSYSDMEYICHLASLELAKGTVKLRDKLGIPIVGFDLAGAEAGYPAAGHWRAFQFVHESFMHKTVHAGEGYGPESIFQAITECHADRIGHGYFLFDADKVRDPKIKDKDRYISDLCQYIADRRVTIEICLTSNLQTNPSLEEIKNHTFAKMLENKLCTTICTDNRTVSKTNVSNEALLAWKNFKFNSRTFKDCIIYGFKRSFFHEDYVKKRAYVRQCINYYDKLVKENPGLL